MTQRERENETGVPLTRMRRQIVCAQGFQGVHPRVGPAPDTTLTPPFYGVVKYLSSPLAHPYRTSLLPFSLFLFVGLRIAPSRAFPLADYVPSSASALLLSFSPFLLRFHHPCQKGGVLAFTLRHALLRFDAWHKRKKRVVFHRLSSLGKFLTFHSPVVCCGFFSVSKFLTANKCSRPTST